MGDPTSPGGAFAPDDSIQLNPDSPQVVRLPGGAADPADPDTRMEDPNLILCTLLCYIGLPTPVWKKLIEMFLEAVWEDYKARSATEQKAREGYAAFRYSMRGYGAFNLFKLVVIFIVKGEIGPAGVSRFAKVEAIRRAMLALAVKLGAKLAALELAEQIVRRVSLYLEGAIFANCAGYCYMEQFAKTMIEFFGAFFEALSETENLIASAGNLLQITAGNVVVRPVLLARASVDPTNWDTSLLPRPTNADFSFVGNHLWRKLQANDLEALIVNLGKPMSTYAVPASLVAALASGLQAVVNARKGFQVTFTPDLIGGMSLLQLVQFMTEWGALKFKRDPAAIADAELAAAP
jgi:hypothetical protein